jgi:hypothetical protein
MRRVRRKLRSTFCVSLQHHGDDAHTHQVSQPSSSAIGPSPSVLAVPDSGHASQIVTNPPPSGFFAGSSNVDASHGVFTDASVTVAGDLHIKVKMNVRSNGMISRMIANRSV